MKGQRAVITGGARSAGGEEDSCSGKHWRGLGK